MPHGRDAAKGMQRKMLFRLHIGEAGHAVGRQFVSDALFLARDARGAHPVGNIEADDLESSHDHNSLFDEILAPANRSVAADKICSRTYFAAALFWARGDANSAKERALPYTQEHKAKTRERIVGSAWRLFNRHGFAGVSIDEIMADAGLTRGGFYNHFATKDELYAEVVTFALASRKEEVATGACVRPRSVREFVSLYLSQAHFDNRETCCPLMALPSDVARGGEPVKRAYRQVLEYMIENFEKGLAGPEARKQAIALASLCVGHGGRPRRRRRRTCRRDQRGGERPCDRSRRIERTPGRRRRISAFSSWLRISACAAPSTRRSG
jgi:TetR/AcrR family transcriptional regulator, transcriptional repressor for nem operon